MKNFLKNYYILILILILSFWAIKPLFASGFFTMHDDTQVARVYEMGKALKEGIFPVRWVPDLGYGYGYPIFNFYAPLSYYVGGFFSLLGFDALVSTKIMMVSGILLSGIFMYLLASEFWGKIGGFVSAIFYIYAPYHAIDIYIRGDVAEFFAYAFIPLMFYGLFKIYQEQKWRWVIVASLAYAGVILSHNLTAAMLTPFIAMVILLYCYIAYKDKKLHAIRYPLYAISIGLLISAFYWLPALLEMQHTNVLSQIGGGANFSDHFVCLSQLWESIWGFGGSIPGCIDGMSFKIGKLHVFLMLLSMFSVLFLITKDKRHHYKEKIFVVLISIFGIIMSIFFMLEISRPIWQAISFMAFIQYPWRFLIFTSFFSSFIIGFSIWLLHNILPKIKYLNNIAYLASGIFVFLLIFFNAKIFTPQAYLPRDVNDYTSESELKWRISKISDEYLPKDFSKPVSFNKTINNFIYQDKAIRIDQLERATQRTKATIYSFKNSPITLNIAPFPAWKIYVDGIDSRFKSTNKGLELFLPEGKHVIEARFEQTTIEKTANSLSFIGIAVLIIGIINTGFSIIKHE